MPVPAWIWLLPEGSAAASPRPATPAEGDAPRQFDDDNAAYREITDA